MWLAAGDGYDPADVVPTIGGHVHGRQNVPGLYDRGPVCESWTGRWLRTARLPGCGLRRLALNLPMSGTRLRPLTEALSKVAPPLGELMLYPSFSLSLPLPLP